LVLESDDGLAILSRDTLQALADALDALSQDTGIRALVLTGSGDRVFSAGADLHEIAALDAERARHFAEFGQNVAQAIARFPVPTIAALNGPAYGGGIELALACDFRLARAGIRLQYQAAKLGLLPGWGGTQRLRALVGPARAKHMMLLCRPVLANEALQWGLLDAVADGPLDPLLERWLADLTALEPQVAIQTKRAIDLVHVGDFAGERDAFAACFAGGRTNQLVREWLATRKEPRSETHPIQRR
ncbi:MAG TPA: enoyl-CoA hydratase/isomerase family protein, partial [Oscillatoriaceae cyanobacterium]